MNREARSFLRELCVFPPRARVHHKGASKRITGSERPGLLKLHRRNRCAALALALAIHAAHDTARDNTRDDYEHEVHEELVVVWGREGWGEVVAVAVAVAVAVVLVVVDGGGNGQTLVGFWIIQDLYFGHRAPKIQANTGYFK